MRDLYAKLSLGPSATEEDIRVSLTHLPLAEKDDIAFILLNAQRRRIYDRAWLTLHTLATLRTNLALDQKAPWLSRNAEFNRPPDDVPLLQQLRSAADLSDAKRKAQNAAKRKNILYGLLAAAMICLFFYGMKSEPRRSSAVRPVPSEKTQQISDERPLSVGNPAPDRAYTPELVARPETRITRMDGKGKAPLKIVTTEGVDYFVRITPLGSKAAMIEAYIRGGETLEARIPLGAYSIKYASGSLWYGDIYFFGDDTLFSKAEQDFKFEQTSRGYSGYTITLIRQRHGNLPTSGIPAADF